MSGVAETAQPLDVTPSAPFAALDVNAVMADANGTNGQPISLTWQVTNNGVGTTNTDRRPFASSLATNPARTRGIRTLQDYARLTALAVGATARDGKRQPGGRTGYDLFVRPDRLRRPAVSIHPHRREHRSFRRCLRAIRCATTDRLAPALSHTGADAVTRRRQVDVTWTPRVEEHRRQRHRRGVERRALSHAGRRHEPEPGNEAGHVSPRAGIAGRHLLHADRNHRTAAAHPGALPLLLQQRVPGSGWYCSRE